MVNIAGTSNLEIPDYSGDVNKILESIDDENDPDVNEKTNDIENLMKAISNMLMFNSETSTSDEVLDGDFETTLSLLNETTYDAFFDEEINKEITALQLDELISSTNPNSSPLASSSNRLLPLAAAAIRILGPIAVRQ